MSEMNQHKESINTLDESFQKEDAQKKYNDSFRIKPLWMAYSALGILTFIYSLFSRAGNLMPFRFLPPFLQAVHAVLFAPVMITRGILIPLLILIAMILFPIYVFPRITKIDWRNNPDAVRFILLRLIGWAIVLICCIPKGFSAQNLVMPRGFLEKYIISPAVAFNLYAGSEILGVLFAVLYRIALAGFSVYRIYIYLREMKQARSGISSVRADEVQSDGRSDLRHTILTELAFFGIGIGSLAILTLILYGLMSWTNDSRNILLGLLSLAFNLVYILFFLAVPLVGFVCATSAVDRVKGLVKAGFLPVLLMTVPLSAVSFIVERVYFHGISVYDLQSEELYNLLYSIGGCLTLQFRSLEIPVSTFFFVHVLEFCVAFLAGLVYTWMIRCPYCNRYGARQTEKDYEETLSSSKYTRIEEKDKEFHLKTLSGRETSGDTYLDAIKPNEEYETHFFTGDIVGHKDIEHKEQDYHSFTFLMRHHTTCKYCGRSLKIRMREHTETSKAGEERISNYKRYF